MQIYSVKNILYSVGNVLNLKFIHKFIHVSVPPGPYLFSLFYFSLPITMTYNHSFHLQYIISTVLIVLLLHVYYFFSYLQELIHSIFSTLFSSCTVLKYIFSSGPHTFNLLYFIGLFNLKILLYLHLNLVVLLHVCYL